MAKSNSTGAPVPPSKRQKTSVAVPAVSEPLTAFNCLERMDDLAMHWESLIQSVLESHNNAAHIYPDPIQPLPDWAVKRLKDEGQFKASGEKYRQSREMLKEALRLASGEGSSKRFEIWEKLPEPGYTRRLECGHETLRDARTGLANWKSEFPNAFIARVHVRDNGGHSDDPAMLDTLVGQMWHMGTAFPGGDEEDLITVQDRTGRNVTVPASVLAAHPVMERLSAKASASVHFSVTRKAKDAGRVKELNNA